MLTISCRCAQTTVCIRAHKNEGIIMHFKDQVVHVRVRWMAETHEQTQHALVGLVSPVRAAAVALPRYDRRNFGKGVIK